MLKLTTLLAFDTIVIQCHDNPDVDSIASGFALYTYFKSHNKLVRLIYSGRFIISKPNLIDMIEALNIPIEYVKELQIDGLLLTIDCQYGAGNVKKLIANNVAIIDHHQVEIANIPLSEIRPYLGSCSTLVWDLLRDEGFDINLHQNVSTALYYGLFCDTNNFAEISHPLDKDMRDNIYYDYNLIRKLKNSNLTLNDLEIAGIALIKCFHDPTYNFAIFKAHPCDPNILGFISDLALQVNTIDLCIVYNLSANGYKFSVRSCVKEIMASDMASYLCENIGSGGGHLEKAGGFINISSYTDKYPSVNIDSFFLNRIKSYYDSYEILFSDSINMDYKEMTLYKKHNISIGYVKSSMIYIEGTPLLIRTIEGDIDIYSSEYIYLMIDLNGDVSPITKNEFENKYLPTDEPFTLDIDYFPSVKIIESNEIINLKSYAKSCIPRNESYAYIKKLNKNIKLFTKRDSYKYMSGSKEDYIAIDKDNPSQVYIITKEGLQLNYTKV
ncbi:DHH family putative phosphoesterase [Natranaerovirga pectinivora]|uniref:DHH family putative phosphoesterase n=1 Tax=Natranaerovirga pectinivora TaxID=682400 RepID=A0A4V2V0C8_9FIRM|nr:DHH family phosphoesterase [Natranaerovirga pectinivora]TCT15450.1 DHH family putative phosphoesterase [Natranaerovirga pectinivora]